MSRNNNKNNNSQANTVSGGKSNRRRRRDKVIYLGKAKGGAGGVDGGIVKTYFRCDWNEFMRAAQHVLIFGQLYTNNN